MFYPKVIIFRFFVKYFLENIENILFLGKEDQTIFDRNLK